MRTVLPQLESLYLDDDGLAEIAKGMLHVGFRRETFPEKSAMRVAQWLDWGVQDLVVLLARFPELRDAGTLRMRLCEL